MSFKFRPLIIASSLVQLMRFVRAAGCVSVSHAVAVSVSEVTAEAGKERADKGKLKKGRVKVKA